MISIPPGPEWVKAIIKASNVFMMDRRAIPPANLIMHKPRAGRPYDVMLVDLDKHPTNEWGDRVRAELRENEPNGYLIIAAASGRRVDADEAKRVAKDARRVGLDDDPLAGNYVIVVGEVFGVGKFAYSCSFERDDEGQVASVGEWQAITEPALIINIEQDGDDYE